MSLLSIALLLPDANSFPVPSLVLFSGTDLSFLAQIAQQDRLGLFLLAHDLPAPARMQLMLSEPLHDLFAGHLRSPLSNPRSPTAGRWPLGWQVARLVGIPAQQGACAIRLLLSPLSSRDRRAKESLSVFHAPQRKPGASSESVLHSEKRRRKLEFLQSKRRAR